MSHAIKASQPSPRVRKSVNGARLPRVLVAFGILAAAVVAASADYIVRRGDTLIQIAAEHGVTVQDLVSANRIRHPDLILIGQSLAIPSAGNASGAIHTVSSGETLRSIAAKYNVTIESIVDLNEIGNPNLIRIGTELSIPNSPDSARPGGGGGEGEPVTYTVEKGDTLASIAARFDTTVDALAAANGITNFSLIYAGSTLRLSGPAFVAEAPASAHDYTVKAGDKLGRIASTFGLPLADLARANSIANVNVIRIGQVLVIPGARSGWRCPIDGPRYINDWGFPRSGGRTHQGNDLFAPRGTQVYAPVSGSVIFLNGRLGGLQFWLKGDDGNTYIGSHLDTVGNPGYVTAGTKLGTVGNTGNAIRTSPHLHFEIHPEHGSATNPFPTLQKFGC